MQTKIIGEISKQAEGYYLIRLAHTGEKPPLPGQFITLKIGSGSDPLLRRPFSIFNYENNVIEVIFQQVGKTTTLLSNYKDQTIDILGPLGNPFSLIDRGEALLVGGGAGNAPLHFLSRSLKEKGVRVTQLYGSRTQALVYCRDRFCSSSDEFVSVTDDGTDGEKGFVTQIADQFLGKRSFDKVYACGPEPMLKALLPIVRSHNVSAEVSLENYFGCGTGLCYGCTIRTNNGNRRVCTDGPVFDASVISENLL